MDKWHRNFGENMTKICHQIELDEIPQIFQHSWKGISSSSYVFSCKFMDININICLGSWSLLRLLILPPSLNDRLYRRCADNILLLLLLLSWKSHWKSAYHLLDVCSVFIHEEMENVQCERRPVSGNLIKPSRKTRTARRRKKSQNIQTIWKLKNF